MAAKGNKSNKPKGRKPPNSGQFAPLQEYDPERYKAVLDGLKKGEGIQAVAARNNTAASTVQRIKHDHAEELGKWKQRVSTRLGQAIEAIGNSLADDPDQIPSGQKAVTLGILVDKKAGLDGDNVTHIVHHKGLTHSSLADRIRSMKQARETPETIDVEDDNQRPGIEGTGL